MRRCFFVSSLIILLSGSVFAQTTPGTKSSLTPAAKSRSTGSNTNTRSAGSSGTESRTSTTAKQTNKREAGNASPSYANRGQKTAPRNGTSQTTARQVGVQKQRSAKTLKPAEFVPIQWMSIEQAVEKCKTERRKIFIDVYTDWCGWCKHMDSTTFTDPAIARYLNEHYYAVKFNAEQTNDVQFKQRSYRFKRDGGRGHHELAAEWLNNKLSYPTVVFLDENQNVIQALGTYLNADKLDAILHYFGADNHRSTPWETYERKYNEDKKKQAE